jgi:hypothetical protein
MLIYFCTFISLFGLFIDINKLIYTALLNVFYQFKYAVPYVTLQQKLPNFLSHTTDTLQNISCITACKVYFEHF